MHSTSEKVGVGMHWFRKGLRLHDNPALIHALHHSRFVYPVFCIDPYFAKPDYVGVNRYNFMLECITDLDSQLRRLGSRLFVLKGNPETTIVEAAERWGVQLLTFESDTEPYSKRRDSSICRTLRSRGISIQTFSSHLLRDPEQYIAASKGEVPNTYAAFQKLFDSLGAVREPLPNPTEDLFLPLPDETFCSSSFDIPTLPEMGYTEIPSTSFKGGESEALQRLDQYVTSRKDWVRNFSKPETSPNSLLPSTTVLSPYLKFGCLSATKFFHIIQGIIDGKSHSEPPVSLHGQLLWREFFYLQSIVTKNFDKMVGNPQCRQIDWDRNPEMILAWKEGKTGYPYIDAIMTQLKVEGWIHHLARHSVACFLTRGDLWQHWEEGVKVFDQLLLDDDWALNNANWQWLSCSNFFYQYFRCYSPVAFGKKTDKNGDYIRKWIPQLASFPAAYIYEPWKAPRNIQERCGCIIGRDYPLPIVQHDTASQDNMKKMQKAYDAAKSSSQKRKLSDESK